MENPIKMDDLGGKTPIFGNIHITQVLIKPRNWALNAASSALPPKRTSNGEVDSSMDCLW